MQKFALRLNARALGAVQKPVLFPDSPHEEPKRFEALRRSPSPDWQHAADLLADGLDTDGLGLAHVRDPLDVDDFLALGHRFGRPLEETDPAVAPFVQRSTVLSLHDRVRSDEDRLAPFTPRPLTLHTEGSRRPSAQQPRYIILMCVDPGVAGDSAQTILVPIPRIVDRLTADDLATLSNVREVVVPGTAPFVHVADDRPRLSFRDLGEDFYQLESNADKATTLRALERLVDACYSARPVSGTRWRRGDIVAIDNHRWMHGRTGSSPASGSARHLQRLRIVADQ